MDIPAPYLILPLQLVQQTVHDVIADEGAGSLRHRGRDPAIAQRADDRFDRQGAEPRGRPAVDDRRVDGLLAFVIGDTRIIDVNRHTFDADIDPAAGLSHRDNQLRLQVFNRRVQRRQRLQQATRGGQIDRGRLIQPGQRGRIVAAPLQQLQQQRRQIAVQDLRLALRRRPFRLFFAEQMQADPRGETTGASGTLRHRCLADALRHQPGQAGARVKAGDPLLGAVDHQADPLDGQTGLGNIGGQHHFALPGRRREDRFALFA